ncbi:MAG: threonine ammonia-lyase [Pseudomonadota bacterium]
MITLENIQEAARRINGKIIKTPLVFSSTFSRMFGAEVYLKLENLQKTGSFKIRGATYKVMTHLPNIGPEGVVAASAGNHAQGVALAARNAGIPATIVMPEGASISKQEATRGYGGKVVFSGKSVGESLEKARELAGEGKTLIHPYEDTDIITGQGTIGLEIFQDLPDTDMIVVPIGGGGLISGIATAAKSIKPEVRVVGVQAAACPSAFESFRSGDVKKVAPRPSIADGINIKQIGAVNFEIIRERVDEIVLVEEAQIAAAILMLLERKKVLAEGSGAVPLAALMNGSVTPSPGSKVVLVVSGGNVDSPLLDRIINKGLIKSGRSARLRLQLDDTPGSLARLLTLVARLEANVLHITHERNVKDLPIYVTRVELELETRGKSHVDEVVSALRKAGYVLS